MTRHIEILKLGGGQSLGGIDLNVDEAGGAHLAGDLEVDGDATIDGTCFGAALASTGAGASWGGLSYNPTATPVANVASVSASLASGARVGNIFLVFGYMSVTPTAGSTLTKVGLSLPVASSITYNGQISGGGVEKFAPSNSVCVYNDSTNNRAELSFTSIGTGTQNIFYWFFCVVA